MASYEAHVDGVAGNTSTGNASINRIYDEVDFTFGTGIEHGAAGLDGDWFYKGF
jgi:hypothetical protein